MKSYVPNARYPLRERLSVSFSGGKTSAYMLRMLIDHFREHEPRREMVVTFANTGCEHEETLRFVDRCDREWGANVVWLEAVVNPERGKGIRHRIVTFETASRKGEPFEAYIRKHGIPNRKYNQCTSRLKLEPMESYRRSLGWKVGTYTTAVGIRADEVDRASLLQMGQGVAYPCLDAGVTKADVREWWAAQPFNLNIPEQLGNCTFCWKKSNRKLLTIAKNHPEMFDFPARMEREHGFSGGDRRDGQERQRRVFFRGNRCAYDILSDSLKPFVEFVDGHFIPFDEDLDVGGACGDSCEIGADDAGFPCGNCGEMVFDGECEICGTIYED